jgi:hypothetical protein
VPFMGVVINIIIIIIFLHACLYSEIWGGANIKI